MPAAFMLIQNQQGKTRLAKYWTPTPEEDRKRYKSEVHQLLAARDQKFQSSFMQFGKQHLVYRRYAGLYCCLCIDEADNRLAYLEAIHLFIEVLDTFFGNVCELDIVFNFTAVYAALDEIFLAGEISETSKRIVLGRLEEFGRQQ